uniref:Uncharacterized protein n=1 Tax=Pipistrellus kuhlii TaxID=59472 RepID=A0A7J7RVY4_PIPKU|nr:hypothetical protein mPipKuh1_010222 [Pipistrellus kuhlii]
MHIIQKSNVLNIKRKTWGSVDEEGAAALDASPRTTVKDVNPQNNKPNTKATSQRVVGGRPAAAAPALSITVTVTATRPRPKPFPLVANLLNTRELPSRLRPLAPAHRAPPGPPQPPSRGELRLEEGPGLWRTKPWGLHCGLSSDSGPGRSGNPLSRPDGSLCA